MFQALADHLWQSILTLLLLQLCVWGMRRNAAKVRFAFWTVAAFKWVVPFAWIAAIGAWLGFPVNNGADRAPFWMSSLIDSLSPWLAPTRHFGVDGFALLACILSLAIATLACARVLAERLRLERWRTARERIRLERNPDDVAPGLGFVRGALFAALSLMLVSGPLLAGAVRDRESRHALLVMDAQSLRSAAIDMKPAAPGMGDRVRIAADERGISIRNTTLQDLAGIAYGVSRYYVRGEHFHEPGEEDWLVGARYDLRISGIVHDPARFDSYALRVPMTRWLAERHGLEIYVNGECQPPCGTYRVPVPDGL